LAQALTDENAQEQTMLDTIRFSPAIQRKISDPDYVYSRTTGVPLNPQESLAFLRNSLPVKLDGYPDNARQRMLRDLCENIRDCCFDLALQSRSVPRKDVSKNPVYSALQAIVKKEVKDLHREPHLRGLLASFNKFTRAVEKGETIPLLKFYEMFANAIPEPPSYNSFVGAHTPDSIDVKRYGSPGSPIPGARNR
jgi:hypothetical protein